MEFVGEPLYRCESAEQKLVSATKFKVDSLLSDGENNSHEVIMKWNGELYYPDKGLTQCDGQKGRYCIVNSGETINLVDSKKLVVNKDQPLNFGAEECDFFSNDHVTSSVTPEKWYFPTCNPYEIEIAFLYNKVASNDLVCLHEETNAAFKEDIIKSGRKYMSCN